TTKQLNFEEQEVDEREPLRDVEYRLRNGKRWTSGSPSATWNTASETLAEYMVDTSLSARRSITKGRWVIS
ncbi:MAG: hypothetical protein JW839_09585, partial [Candidatus Lokiarchaeota archaeon]|nr:hypothetical protein [Candidatus Lokiarchaeota archaeon]